LRILWYSNAPWAPTGYGQQTGLWVPKLQAAGHDVAVAAFHGLQGVPIRWNNMTVYPGSSEDQWAQDVMLGHYQQHKADLMITLMDAWVLDPERMVAMGRQGAKVVHWQPVDCEPLSMLDHRLLAGSGTRTIAMSRFGERQLAEFGPLYVPHGIDTQMFKPLDEDVIRSARERGGLEGKFVIGINAANQDPVRKAFGEQLAAFRLFADRHPDARLLIHTRAISRTGNNLERIIDVLKLQGLVQFGDQYLTVSGLTTPPEIARWYGIMDLFSNCSYGEGFGLPVLEAQSSGTPVVVTDCSAMTELCGSGWLVDGEFYWNAGHNAWWTRPSIQNILAAYEMAYQERGTPEAEKRRLAAREFALQYDADVVLKEYWEPVLDELAGVAGTDKHGGLRWMPGADHEDAVVAELLALMPEGGVLLDAVQDSGEVALRAAEKAGRVLAPRLDPVATRENAELNSLDRIVIVQDELDVSLEPFIDIIRLDYPDLDSPLRAIIAEYKPALLIEGAKGRHGFREKMRAMGYHTSLIPRTTCVKAVRA
jgi:glycosyltransferase involved in cell wall biosynthesis